ncbi:MAG: hypothetical protein AAFN10_26870 [Bacteroidota bacterium]
MIHLPPLRERGNDVVILAKHFLNDFCNRNKMPVKTLSRDTLTALMNHNWPGNVRELRAVVERSVLISDGQEIQEEDLIFSDSIF